MVCQPELVEGYRFDCQYLDIQIAIGLIVILSLSKYWQSNHLLRQQLFFSCFFFHFITN